MVIFDSESDLVDSLQEYFFIIKNYIDDGITYSEFYKEYNDFYFYYALDGHESDDEEKLLLKKYSDKIEFFNKVTSILSGICSDEDAEKDIFIKVGRYNAQVAKSKLKQLSNFYSKYFIAV